MHAFLPKVIDYKKFVARGELVSGMLKRNVFTRNKGIFSLVSDVSVKLSFRQNENGEVTLKLQGMFLKRTPTVRPILDHDWFLKAIASAEELRRAKFATPEQQAELLG